jgi:hypothetical protein
LPLLAVSVPVVRGYYDAHLCGGFDCLPRGEFVGVYGGGVAYDAPKSVIRAQVVGGRVHGVGLLLIENCHKVASLPHSRRVWCFRDFDSIILASVWYLRGWCAGLQFINAQ